MRFKLAYKTRENSPAQPFGYANYYGKTLTFDVNHFELEDLPVWIQRRYKVQVRRILKAFCAEDAVSQQRNPVRYDPASGLEVDCQEWRTS